MSSIDQHSMYQRIQDQIISLDTLERTDLVDMWVEAYGSPPFKGMRKSTLIRGIAYHIHCQHFGRLKPSISRELLKTAQQEVDGTSSGKTPSPSRPRTKVKPGSQLVREWNGRTHTVHVTDKGYVMSGVTYTSLSAITRAITGAHWSGPRFFGVSA